MAENEEIGFIGLVSEENKLASMMLENIHSGQLGLGVLNDYFSEKLFPSVSTLMPNLVYCYLIFALTWKRSIDEETRRVNEDGEEEDSREVELREITMYSSKPGESMAGAGLGFHGKVKESVIGTHRNFMRRYGFFDMSENSEFKKLNEKLENSKRYKEIRSGLRVSKYSGNAVKTTLAPMEKADMIMRCKILVEKGEGSLFDYLIDSLYEITKASGKAKIRQEALGKILVLESCKKAKSIQVFENLGSIIHDIANQSDNFKLLKVYEAARFTSLMEYYIKCRSNQLLRLEKDRIRGTKSSIPEINFENMAIGSVDTDTIMQVIESEACKEKMQVLIDIYEALQGENAKDADKLIREVINSTDEEEKTVWNRKEITEYIDTFRWEYRPEEKKRQAGSSTKCASFFVMELLGDN